MLSISQVSPRFASRRWSRQFVAVAVCWACLIWDPPFPTLAEAGRTGARTDTPGDEARLPGTPVVPAVLAGIGRRGVTAGEVVGDGEAALGDLPPAPVSCPAAGGLLTGRGPPTRTG